MPAWEGWTDQPLDRKRGHGVSAAEKLPSLFRVQKLALDLLSAEPSMSGVRSGVGSPLAAVGLSPLARRAGQGRAVPGGAFQCISHPPPSGQGVSCTQPQPGSCQLLASSCGGRAGVSGWRIKDKALILLLPPTTTKRGSVVALWSRGPYSIPRAGGTSPVLPPGPPPAPGPGGTPRAPCFRRRFACKVRQLLGAHCGFPQQLLSFIFLCCCWLGVFWGCWVFFCRGQTDLVGWIFFFLCVTFVSF